jgi:sec-independent protein translocase protein TatB
MDKKWKEENERIMREHPMIPGPEASPETQFASDALPAALPELPEPPFAPDTAPEALPAAPSAEERRELP